jgi:hypothetical protein
MARFIVFPLLLVLIAGITIHLAMELSRRLTLAATQAAEARKTAAAQDMAAQKKRAAAIDVKRQRFIAQYKQLWYEDDYSRIRSKAFAGDALAQRQLAQIYSHCIVFNGLRRFGDLAAMEKKARTDPRIARNIAHLKARNGKFCGPGRANMEANDEHYQFWMQESAKRGDAASKMDLIRISQSGGVSSDDLLAYIRAAVDSGDPAAIQNVATLLGLLKDQWPDPNTAAAIRGPYAFYAWTIAACRIGMDCGPDSQVVYEACLGTQQCEYDHYETLTYARIKPQPVDKTEVERVVALVHTAFRVHTPPP